MGLFRQKGSNARDDEDNGSHGRGAREGLLAHCGPASTRRMKKIPRERPRGTLGSRLPCCPPSRARLHRRPTPLPTDSRQPTADSPASAHHPQIAQRSSHARSLRSQQHLPMFADANVHCYPLPTIRPPSALHHQKQHPSEPNTRPPAIPIFSHPEKETSSAPVTFPA